MNGIAEIVNRWNSPTPPFFKRVQEIGISLAAVGAAILSAPVALPAILLSAASYALVAGSVLATLSQTAKAD